MSIAVFLKDNLRNIPPGVGRVINYIPYSIRPGLGKIYRKRTNEITKFEFYSLDEKKLFVLERIKRLVSHAYENVPFYHDHYNKSGFRPGDLNKFEDIKEIPLVDKSILTEWEIEKRSAERPGRYIVNTGGSSGTPFSFYIEPGSMGHEWAHMHRIWGKLGYVPSDLKLLFGGRSDLKQSVEYDVLRNHFALNIYADYIKVAKKLKPLLRKYQIKYLHGYPSSIYDFALYCQNEAPELQALLTKQLKGVFFGSEYPHAHYRETIEAVFGVDTVSWYGHTERAVLAYERAEKFTYEPFPTYGFAEALKIDEENYHLVATSYYNYASPLIRYNTNDIISDPISEAGILKSFKITKGREGEYILDRQNKKINLTGLIFGRHHEIFNYSKFIQVKQPKPGKIEVHFVSDTLSEEKATEFFDQKSLDLEIIFVKRDEPVRTTAGKINLLIK